MEKVREGRCGLDGNQVEWRLLFLESDYFSRTFQMNDRLEIEVLVVVAI